MDITYKDATFKQGPDKHVEIKVEMDGKNTLLFALNTWVLRYLTKKAEEDDSDDLRRDIEAFKADMETIDRHVLDMTYKVVRGKINFNINTRHLPTEDRDAVTERLQKALSSHYVQEGIRLIDALNKQTKKKKKDKGHKQSRSLVRSVAKMAGKDTTQPSLFSLPFQSLKEDLERQLSQSQDGILIKEKFSQKTGTLALLLVGKYGELPKNEDGSISITDVPELAAMMKTSVQEIKYMLLYLSGFQYPHVAHYTDAKEIGFRMSKLFDIEFFYDQKHEKKIELSGAHIRVEGVLDIVRNVRIKRLQVKPTPQFIRDLNGKGSGYIQIQATDAYLAMCHELSLVAFKIMNYSMANRPEWKISEGKLFEALGLVDMLKKQGRPRTLATVGKALEELKQKGHLLEYETPAETGDMYSWKCASKYAISQQEKQQRAQDGQEFIDYADKSIPVDKRRQRYAEYMQKEFSMPKEKAWSKAVEKIPE